MLNYESLSTKELVKQALNLNDERIVEEVTTYFGSLESFLLHSETEELETVGITPSRLRQLLAFKEMVRRINEVKPLDPVRVTSPDILYNIVKNKLSNLEYETFNVALLNTKNNIIDIIELSKGTINYCVAAPREVYKVALRRNANGIIIIHNHPSGDPTPSSEDINLTKRMDAAGQNIGIKLLDHIIVGSCGFKSLKQEGLM